MSIEEHLWMLFALCVANVIASLFGYGNPEASLTFMNLSLASLALYRTFGPRKE